MKKHFYVTALLLVISFCMQNLVGQETRPWFQDGPWHRPVPNPKAKLLPLIKVEGNRFVDPEGKTVLFRGTFNF